MKKAMFLLCLFISVNISAQEVTKAEAEQVARNFYLENYKIFKNKPLAKLQFIKSSGKFKSEQLKSLYIFNNEGDAGFVIVSGNKATYPILAYSLDGKFDEAKCPRW